MGIRIMGVGSYLPRTTIENNFFSQKIESMNEKIKDAFAGAEERRHAAADEAARKMAVWAGERAIQNAGVHPKEIDLLLSFIEATEYYIPRDDYLVLEALGLTNAVCYPASLTCLTFVSLLNQADAFIRSGKYKKILIICSINWIDYYLDRSKDYSWAGDGAGAVIVESSEADSFVAAKEKSYPQFFKFNYMKNAHFTRQPEFFRFSSDPKYGMSMIKLVPNTAKELLHEAGIRPEDIRWFIAHQPGLKALELWCKLLNIPIEKNLNTFRFTANMSAANIPVILDHYINKKAIIRRGDLILFIAPGSGIHVASVIWRY